jgi:GT2 family glycosyltransferase
VPPKSSRSSAPGHLVTAVLVSHDGVRWLGECLAALTAQTHAPHAVVAVDTGSSDGSPAMLATHLGESAVLSLPRQTSLADAVRSGLEAVDGSGDDSADGATRWVWILHDDCAPDASALRELLAAATDSPSLAAIAPKVLTWDRRGLREIGLTIDSSGRTHTGLEPREVDQGQHDDTADVLAAGTAGLLVRRDVWDRLGGLDATWPLFGDDVDLGWRLNAAGERLRVAPRAVVRHAAALTARQRKPDAVDGRQGAVVRRNGMQIVLANTAAALVPLLMARYVVECLLRSLVLLLFARRPADALDELAALRGVLLNPKLVKDARQRRRGRVVRHRDVRGLMARPSHRWRLFGDQLAAAFRGRDAVEQRSRRRAPVESGPVSAESESMDLDDVGMLTRIARRPGVLLALGLTVIGLIADRSVLGGTLHGGRLLAAPAGASDLWSTYLAGWHSVGLGSTQPAPPALAILALLSSVLAGKVWLAVSVLLLGAVPLAGISAYLSAGALTRSPWLRIWAAVIWASLPALSGAVAGGRIDVVVTVIVVPLLARSVASALRADARLHRAVGAGLVLAVAAAFSPVLWPLTAVVAAGSLILAGRRSRRLVSALAMLVTAAAACLPWTVSVLHHPALLVRGLGLVEPLHTPRPLPTADLVLMHPGGPAQPWVWVLAPVLAAAFVGLGRASHRVAARVGVAVFLLAVVGSVLVSRQTGAAVDDASVHYWTGATATVAALGVLIAALVAGNLARPALRRYAFGWRQPVTGLLVAALLAGTGVAVVQMLVRGLDRPLTGDTSALLPEFAAAEVGRSTAPRLLVLDGVAGGTDSQVRYGVIRDPSGLRLGDADVEPIRPTAADNRLTDVVRQAAAGEAVALPRLAEFGVSMLVVRGTGARALARLADLDGLDRVPTTGAIVWRGQMPTGELVMLGPRVAAQVTGGGDLPADAHPHPLPTGRGHSRADVPSGATGRLLVLAEPASKRWRASLDGRQLTPTTAYGWAQAWKLPAAGGHLDLGHTDGHRSVWLGLQLAVVVVAALLAIPVPGRRTESADEEAT